MGVIASGVSSIIAQAKRAAQRRGQRTSTAHLLLCLLQSAHETAGLLSRHGVRESDLLSALKVVDDEPGSAFEVAIERASKLAAGLGEPMARPIHLLMAIVRDPRTAGYRCLDQVGASASKIRRDVDELLGVGPSVEPPEPEGGARNKKRSQGARPILPPTDGRRPRRNATRPSARARSVDLVRESHLRGDATSVPLQEETPQGSGEGAKEATARPELAPFELDPRAYPTLTSIGRNLTALAAAGRIDPVVGRDRELEQLLDVLSRRKANNPLLVGPPGVGKTALVEGLACRLVAGAGVAGLEGRVLVEVSAGSLVSGTGVRGALAERMQRLREEVEHAAGRVLLFIDEIHAVVGGDGPDDLAHELKASLARGELPCIGATTDAELRRCFERDAALARRFSTIRVSEPSPASALEILEGILPRYEAHHGVRYDASARTAAVDLSVRYLTERQLPDKAIGVLDQAAARVRRRGGVDVDLEAVAAVIAELADVPIERLLARDADRMLALEDHLADRIVGQERAVVRIADTLRKGAAGFRGKRPLGTFLLLGPTGVGKTEMAKAVAEVVFPAGAMTRFDMSEYSESHAVARLLGAPPGYVGHEDGGQLTEAVRRRPYQLLLLDEIEKAHAEVLLAFLPLLDEGRLTDAKGRTVDFTHTIVFMTSNLGAGRASAGRIGFGGASGGEASEDARERAAEAAIAAARAALPPELYNRIDEPLHFAPLERDEIEEIARRMLSGVAASLVESRGVVLDVDPSALAALVAAGGYDPTLGARPMRRTIGRLVESPLAAKLLAGELVEGDEVILRGDGDRIEMERIASVDAAE
jgi:ATP-dependent Clp protease ATP-binding subunit ClpC